MKRVGFTVLLINGNGEKYSSQYVNHIEDSGALRVFKRNSPAALKFELELFVTYGPGAWIKVVEDYEEAES